MKISSYAESARDTAVTKVVSALLQENLIVTRDDTQEETSLRIIGQEANQEFGTRRNVPQPRVRRILSALI
jgi:hypothetical protein